VGGGGIDKSDAGEHVGAVCAGAELVARLGQVGAIVYAKDFVGGSGHGGDGFALVSGNFEKVREVELAGGRALGDVAEGGQEKLGVAQVHAGVDLAQSALGGGGVFVFDDAVDVAVLADDASVPGWIEKGGGEEAELAGRGGQQALQGLGGQKGSVAVQNEDFAAACGEFGELFKAATNGVGSAFLLGLEGETQVGEGVGTCSDGGLDGLGLMAYDDGNGRHGQRWKRGKDVVEEGSPAQRKKNFGAGGTHAGALASSEDEGVKRGVHGRKPVLAGEFFVFDAVRLIGVFA